MKYAQLCIAAIRINGEIYRYRTRSGMYTPKTKNQALNSILNGTVTARAGAQGSAQPAQSVETASPPVKMSRVIFAEQVNEIYLTLATAMQLDKLSDAPHSFR